MVRKPAVHRPTHTHISNSTKLSLMADDPGRPQRAAGVLDRLDVEEDSDRMRRIRKSKPPLVTTTILI